MNVATRSSLVWSMFPPAGRAAEHNGPPKYIQYVTQEKVWFMDANSMLTEFKLLASVCLMDMSSQIKQQQMGLMHFLPYI